MFRGVGLVALLLACASSLPEYARPKGEIASREAVNSANLIAYRTLTREDFAAARPPPQIRGHRDSLGAATCGLVRPSADSQIAVVLSNGSFKATIPRLRFEARMDRDCSWWNPDFERAPPEYVLQHEQIHFAIYELGARRLNARAKRIAASLASHGDTAQEAATEVERKFQRVIRDGLDQILDRSQAFDEDTSMSRNAKRQAEWGRRVDAELASTEP